LAKNRGKNAWKIFEALYNKYSYDNPKIIQPLETLLEDRDIDRTNEDYSATLEVIKSILEGLLFENKGNRKRLLEVLRKTYYAILDDDKIDDNGKIGAIFGLKHIDLDNQGNKWKREDMTGIPDDIMKEVERSLKK
jgi:hypothetical protein